MKKGASRFLLSLMTICAFIFSSAVDLSAATVVLTADPESESTITSPDGLDFITLTFNELGKRGDLAFSLKEDPTLDDIEVTLNGTPIDVSQRIQFSNPKGIGFRPGLTEPGEYRIILSQGLYNVTLSDNTTIQPSDREILIYTVRTASQEVPEVKWTTNPAANTTVPSIDKFSVKFTGATDVEYNNIQDGSEITLTHEGTTLSYLSGIDDGDNAGDFVLDEAISTEGPVTVKIKAGTFSMTINGQSVENPDIEWSFNIEEKKQLEVADVKLTTDPADGAELNEVGTINVVLPQGVTAELNEDLPEDVTLSVTVNGQPYQNPTMRSATSFIYRPEMTERGTFRITFPEGFYILTLADGSKALSPEFSSTFSISGGMNVLDVASTTVPAQDAEVKEGLKEFSVAFAGTSEVAFGPNVTAEGVTLKAGETVLKYGEGLTEGDAITTMVLDETLFGENQLVEVSIAEGFYQLTLTDGTSGISPAVNFSFTVNAKDGILSISAENGNTVYTLDGVVVARDADAATVNALPEGIYVINGKVVVKK